MRKINVNAVIPEALLEYPSDLHQQIQLKLK
jgi:hypothetical protein